jgi:adenylosuccinate lyase
MLLLWNINVITVGNLQYSTIIGQQIGDALGCLGLVGTSQTNKEGMSHTKSSIRMATTTPKLLSAPQKKMASQYDTYQTSLTSRYCSLEMSKLFSPRSRHSTWRKLWLGLAESERELGIDTITPKALEQMRAHLHVTDEDFEIARIKEKRRRQVSDFMFSRRRFIADRPFCRMSWR